MCEACLSFDHADNERNDACDDVVADGIRQIPRSNPLQFVEQQYDRRDQQTDQRRGDDKKADSFENALIPWVLQLWKVFREKVKTSMIHDDADSRRLLQI